MCHVKSLAYLLPPKKRKEMAPVIKWLCLLNEGGGPYPHCMFYTPSVQYPNAYMVYFCRLCNVVFTVILGMEFTWEQVTDLWIQLT